MAKSTNPKKHSKVTPTHAEAVPVATEQVKEQYILELEAELGTDLEVPRGRLDVDGQARVDRMLFKLSQLHKEVEEVEEMAGKRMQDIQAWADRMSRGKRSQIQYLRVILEDAAANIEFPGDRKSLSLPFGTLGRRSQSRTITVIDKEKAIKFCEKKGIPVKVEKSLYLNELKSWSKQHNDALPPGCEWEEKEDKPYVTLDK